MTTTFTLSKEDITETIDANEIYFLKTDKIQENIDLSIRHRGTWNQFLTELKDLYEKSKQAVLAHEFTSEQEYLKIMQETFHVDRFKLNGFENEYRDWLKI